MATETATNDVRDLRGAQSLIQARWSNIVACGEAKSLYARLITEVAFVDGSILLVNVSLTEVATAKHPA